METVLISGAVAFSPGGWVKAGDLFDGPLQQVSIGRIVCLHRPQHLKRLYICLPGYDLDGPFANLRIWIAEQLAHYWKHRRATLYQHPLGTICCLDVA